MDKFFQNRFEKELKRGQKKSLKILRNYNVHINNPTSQLMLQQKVELENAKKVDLNQFKFKNASKVYKIDFDKIPYNKDEQLRTA